MTAEAEKSWREVFAFLASLEDALTKLTAIVQEKTAAVRRDDLNGVNECMKREQVVSLSLRSMDAKRARLLAAAGLGAEGAVKLSALPERCPPALRQEARERTERLQNAFALYHSAAEVSRDTLECNLHQIEAVIAAAGGEPEAGETLADIRA